MPPVASDNDDRARSHVEIRIDGPPRLRDDIGLLLLAAEVLGVQLIGKGTRLVGHCFVGCQQQPRGNVWGAHAPGGVHTRANDKPDVVAVDLFARQTARFEQRAKPNLVRARRERRESELRNDTVLSDQWDNVGERSNRGNFDECRQPACASRMVTERLNELERDADASEVLIRIRAIVRLGLITASAGGSDVSGSW